MITNTLEQNLIRNVMYELSLIEKVHRIKIEIDFVDFSYISQELIKPNRVREIGKDEK